MPSDPTTPPLDVEAIKNIGECWTFHYADERREPEEEPHYYSEAEAQKDVEAYTRNRGVPLVERLNAPYFVVTCPTCVTDLDCDDWSQVHFRDVDEARAAALANDWVEASDGRLYCCWACAPIEADVEESSDGS